MKKARNNLWVLFITNTGEAVAFACFILTKRYDEAVQQLFFD
ncbi:hypothetical protein EJK48_1174 [Moraxella catarrhalis]|uniref:Uncharacterized protein n=1 Tax=Moraxella catarrhalis TaxID=480 RepID=A0A3Q9GFB3_MORCA|nr:hypothetical protein EJK53_1173 [Moraxella catarrhalis]AZQ94518.1 hypothetical protein EJK48_1174 [Moraxella catarrhalis]RUO12319.1 hypothetical protein EJK49_0290 [Moraxella catarrhalis]